MTKYSKRIEPISGTPKDFRVREYNSDYPELADNYSNCLVHYWLEETDYVYNGTQKICISGLDYDSIDDFHYGLCVVGKNGKYGLINLKFNVVLGLYYDGISECSWIETLNEPICRVYYGKEEKGWVDQHGCFIVIIGKPTNKKELLSSIGRIPSNDIIWAYKSDCKWFRVELKCSSFDTESIYSFYDVDSQLFNSNLLQDEKNDLIAESDYVNGMGILKNRKSGLYGAVDMSGRISVPVVYDKLSRFSDDGVAVICEGAKEVVEHHSPAYYLSIKYKKGGKWGAINKLGEVLYPAQYDYAYGYSEGLAAVNLGGEYYVYLYEKPGFYLDNTIPEEFRAKIFIPWFMGGKWGFVDIHGKECIPIQYDRVFGFRNGVAIVNIGGSWTGGSLRNKYEIPSYEQQRPAFLGGHYGIINRKGDLLTPMIYSYLQFDSSDPFCITGFIGGTIVKEDGDYYLADPKKRVVLSLEGEVIEEDVDIYDGEIWSITT